MLSSMIHGSASALSTSAAQTQSLGEELGKRLRAGDLVTLRGELGAGKTTFVQGLARALGISEITSPTFVLIIEHEGAIPLLHLDAYRLESLCFDAVRDAGVDEFLARTDAIKLVEWPQMIADFLPLPNFAVEIEHGENENERRVKIQKYA